MPKRKTEKFINQKSEKLVLNATVEAERLRSMFQYDGMKENLRQILNDAGMVTKIHFYGSRVIGLAHSESDMDIYIAFLENQ